MTSEPQGASVTIGLIPRRTIGRKAAAPAA
jgi:hypothetical protein